MSFEAELSAVPFLGLEENWQVVNNVAFRRLAEDVVTTAKENIDPSRSGLHNRSGMLRDSIKLRRFFQLTPGGTGEAVIGAGNNRVKYAAIHERGGIIKPKNKPYLTFKINGKWFRKKQVVIPKRSYLQPAADDRQADYEKYLSEAIAKIVEQL